MAAAGVKRLPVVSPDDPDPTRSASSRIGDLLKARQRLVEEEAKRERFFGQRDVAEGVNPA